METISILQALALIQNQHSDKIVIYDSDEIAFHLVSNLDAVREKTKTVEVEIHQNKRFLSILGDRIYYYVVLNEKTQDLLTTK